MSIESMAIVLHHSRTTGTAKVVAIGIANHDGDGGAWPTIETLAHYANVSERAVRDAIAQLVSLGEVVVKRKAGGLRDTDYRYRPNLYELRIQCPPDCDGTKHHRTKRKARHLPLPLPEADCREAERPLPEAGFRPLPEAERQPLPEVHHPLTTQGNHPENAVGLEGASTTEAPPAAESLAAIRSILSARSAS